MSPRCKTGLRLGRGLKDDRDLVAKASIHVAMAVGQSSAVLAVHPSELTRQSRGKVRASSDPPQSGKGGRDKRDVAIGLWMSRATTGVEVPCIVHPREK